tara:strand:- start:4314 stop:4691 length:378 start_codon:yes stop_codon:yes gene_type:complete
MALVDEFLASPSIAHAQVARDPTFANYLSKEDYTVITVTKGDIHSQMRVLSRKAAVHVLDRMLVDFKRQGADLKHWICRPVSSGGLSIASFVTGIPDPIEAFVGLFSFQGISADYLRTLCNCGAK